VTTKAAPDASTAGPSPNVANSKAPTTVADDAAAPATTKRAPVAEDDEVVTRKIVPGQEEMAKADHASDAAAAAAWLWKATAKGNPEAPVRLSDMYIRGDGVPRSCDQALVLLKSAAEKQNARARNRLASMYATGTCVPRDRVQAYRWLSLALISDPSSEWAQQNRSLIWRQMTAEEKAAAAKYQTK
jgi:TPR repeat protein